MKERYIPIRPGIAEYLLRGEISAFEFGVYVIVHLQADYSTGIWRGSAPRILNSAPRGAKLREIQRAIEHLTDLGLLKHFHKHGHRGNFPFLINKFTVRSGPLKGMRLNAEESTSWQHPIYEPCADADADVRAQDAAIQEVTEIRREEQTVPAASPQDCAPLPLKFEKPLEGRIKLVIDRAPRKRRVGADSQDPLSVLDQMDGANEQLPRDPRHKAVAEAFTVMFKEHNPGLSAPFNGSDAKQLQMMLREQPDVGAEQIIRWLLNAFDSDLEFPLRRGFRLREFCSHYSKYVSGPLHRALKTEQTNHARSCGGGGANEVGKFDDIKPVA